MDENSIYINDPNQNPKPAQSPKKESEEQKQEEKPQVEDKKPEIKNGGMPSETKLWIVTLVLIFIALNVWGFYFYKKGFFNIGADISSSPTPTVPIEKSDSVYMIPGPGI